MSTHDLSDVHQVFEVGVEVGLFAKLSLRGLTDGLVHLHVARGDSPLAFAHALYSNEAVYVALLDH